MSEHIFTPATMDATKQLGHIGGAFAKLGEEALTTMQKRQAEEELEASLPPLADIYTMRPNNGSYRGNRTRLFACPFCDGSGAVMIPMNVVTLYGTKRHLVAFGCDCGDGGKIKTYADHFGMPYRFSPDWAKQEASNG